MENRRFFLIAVLGALLFFSYQTWRKDYPEQPPAEPVAASVAPTAASDELLPPKTPTDAPITAAAPAEAAPASADPKARIRVQTDLLRVEISLAGGDLRRAELIGYPVSKAQPEIDLALLDDRDPHFFILQSGLAGPERALVSANTAFTSSAASYALAEGKDHLEVSLDAQTAEGLKLRKTYRFTRGSYRIDLVQSLQNGSAVPVQAAAYARLQRTAVAAGTEPPFVSAFMGLGFYEQKEDGSYRFKKISYDNLDDESFETTQTGGWLAALQHYFIAAILPPAGEKAVYSGKPSAVKGYLGQYYGVMQSAAPGAELSYATGFYVGPKLQNTLDTIAPGLELSEDYGILTPIAKPLFWFLRWIHQHTGNWGVAIILLTLAVKAAMYKLSEAQFRSMAKMKKFAPRIQDIKDRYAGDRERLNKAMMELYTKEGFNPLAGCWPLLVQFPVFIALYWVLNESVELRQASFMLWLTDLSAPDPYFVLPVLFGASMWAQQKISGQSMTLDPMQQRMMQFMPIALTAFFAFFPAGLVLYWFVSNLITIAQQWWIGRTVEREQQLKAASAK